MSSGDVIQAAWQGGSSRGRGRSGRVERLRVGLRAEQGEKRPSTRRSRSWWMDAGNAEGPRRAAHGRRETCEEPAPQNTSDGGRLPLSTARLQTAEDGGQELYCQPRDFYLGSFSLTCMGLSSFLHPVALAGCSRHHVLISNMLL